MNTTQNFSAFSFSELKYGRSFPTQPWKFRQNSHIKSDDVWNSANPLFKWRFHGLSSRNFATMVTWRNNISSLFNGRLRVFRKSGRVSLEYFKIRFLISDSFDSQEEKSKLRVLQQSWIMNHESWILRIRIEFWSYEFNRNKFSNPHKSINFIF